MSETAAGRLHSINISPGGVPKEPVSTADVRLAGIRGDRQRDLRYHGGPERAVSLFSFDLIRALQGEGHPIVPGAIGENLTLDGIDWSRLVPGLTLDVGVVRLELTSFAAPCKTIGGAFLERRFIRVSQKVRPGWSRLYARVLTEGTIRIGDIVRCVPG